MKYVRVECKFDRGSVAVLQWKWWQIGRFNVGDEAGVVSRE